MKYQIKSSFLPVAAVISLAVMAGCAPVKTNRGNIVETYRLAEVQPGIDGKDEVIKKIGSPTTMAPFDDNTWYYLGQKFEKHGILDPELKQEKIVVVTFGADGFVDKIVERREGREDVPLVDRKTPTSGNEVTVMQQLLGNLGRFNKKDGNAATTATGGSTSTRR
jgi:outer membrane protein assembly factor BamE (lipoprotein component of BamABCDE complex)